MRVFFFKQKTAYEIMPSLVGSEMCIRDRYSTVPAATSIGTCVDCVAGRYAPGTGNDEEADCVLCAAGKYFEQAAQCSDVCLDLSLIHI